MPGYLLNVGASVICMHGGQVQPLLPNPQVNPTFDTGAISLGTPPDFRGF